MKNTIRLALTIALAAPPAAFAAQVSPFPQSLVQISPFNMVSTCSLDHHGRGYSFHPGSYTLHCTLIERDPNVAGASWVKSQGAYTTSFALTAVGSREAGTELYVAGIKDDGTDIIEKWTFPTRTGGVFYRFAGAAVPLGTASGAFSGTLGIQGGGSFDPLQSGAALPQPIRRLAVEGSLGHVRALLADPEGRYLLYIRHDTSQLVQIPLLPSAGTPEVLYSPAQIPSLPNLWSISAYHNASSGARYVRLVDNRGGELKNPFVLLKDSDNDGDFEAIEELTDLDWYQQSYAVWKQFYCAAPFGP